MLDDFGRPGEVTDLADARDIAAFPLDAELEILVRVEAVYVDFELWHWIFPYACT